MRWKPHLSDFGLAKDTRTESKYTRTGQTLGTPAYMSPEQARGDLAQLTPASDVWALGCVLFELIANRPAFEGDTPAAVIGNVMTGRPAWPAGLSRPVKTLLRVCLCAAPEVRPSSAAVLRQDCDRVLAGTAPATRESKSRTALLAGVGVAALLAGGIVVWSAVRPGTVAPVPSPEAEATALAEAGWGRRHSDPAEAARLLQQAIDRVPSRDTWRIQLGLALWATGSDAAAHDAWSSVRDSSPQFPQAQWYVAFCDFADASAFDRPLSTEARAALTAALAASGDTGRLAHALDLYIQGARSESASALAECESWEADALRALLTDRRGGEDVIEQYDRALSSGLRLPVLISNRGANHAKQGKFDSALRDFGEALAAVPTFRGALVGRAMAHAQAGDAIAARRDIAAALAAAPGSAFVRYKQSQLEEILGDLLAARKALDAALDLDSGFVAALVDRARLRTLGGDLAGALGDADRAVTASPGEPQALRRRALIQSLRGEFGAARADMTALLELTPNDVGALVLRASFALVVGDVESARADVRAALAAAPGDPGALVMRARMRAADGDVKGATADLDEAVERAPLYAEARIARGKLRDWARDHRGARADFEVALETAVTPETLKNLARQCAILKDWPAAAAAFSRFLSEFPQHKDREIVAGALEVAQAEAKAAQAKKD
jgi:tetratricopeptide (TPR) repeat protein